MTQKFALYDLDRTIVSTPTFTLFLFWAAATTAPWRLLLTPIWLVSALGYALKMTNRNGFKPMAIRLFLGRDVPAARMADMARRFAEWRVPADVAIGAAVAIAQDRAEGYRLIMATAAPEFYAQALGDRLGFEAVIASRHVRGDDGAWRAEMDGENCYGAEKGRRVAAWLADQMDGSPHHIRAYSDHPSDAPLFALADEAVLVGRGAKPAALAERHGWSLRDFSKG